MILLIGNAQVKCIMEVFIHKQFQSTQCINLNHIHLEMKGANTMSLDSRAGVANPRPALNIFQAREIHHIFTKYIYFIMARVVKTNVSKNTLFLQPYIQKLTVEIMRKS